jgi:hypothetical protein
MELGWESQGRVMEGIFRIQDLARFSVLVLVLGQVRQVERQRIGKAMRS